MSTLYHCYYPFTRKYDDLAAKLSGFLKELVQQDENQNAINIIKHDNMEAIPKHLFDKACQEVMPLAENIWKLLLKISIILLPFFLVFEIASPGTLKITAAFVVSAMPMIVEIVTEKKEDETEKLRKEWLDEKIQFIVDEYYNNLFI